MSETATVPAGVASSSEGSPAAGVLPGRRLLVLILLLVNTAATVGQSGWFLDNVTGTFGLLPYVALGLAVVIGAVLEMIGAYLATMADALDAQRLPSGGVRAGSYGVGLLIGALNFAHWWANGWQASVSLGFLSAISPFLWGIYARVRRGTPTAPSRRLWHPFRSFTLVRFMAWEGIASEEEGVIALEMSGLTSDDNAPTSGTGGRSMADIGREAVRLKAEQPGRSWESIAEEFRVSDSYLRRCRKAAGACAEGEGK